MFFGVEEQWRSSSHLVSPLFRNSHDIASLHL